MTEYETKEGRYHFEFDYTAKEFENSNGVGHTWRELEIEITEFGVWEWVIDDHVEVVDEVKRKALLDEYHDELLDEVERLEQSKRQPHPSRGSAR